MKYSVVIPVYNSESIIEKTVNKTVSCLNDKNINFEIILVNDGSKDNSWAVVKRLAEKDSNHIIAINLLSNYGQHVANLCGFENATGDYVITMDDDLQNPPEEISKLIEKSKQGHDLVLGQFIEKKHAGYRRIGSKIIRFVNKKIFDIPDELVMSNFRLIHRSVVERVCSYNSSYPYIPGLVVKFSASPANTLVYHNAREEGKSNYSLGKILSLVSEILFNFSSYPLRIIAGFGLFSAIISSFVSLYYLFYGVFFGSSVPGWTTVVVLLSLFNSIVLFILGMMGEYLIRIIRQTSSSTKYYIKERVGE